MTSVPVESIAQLRGATAFAEPGSAGLRRQLEVATGATWRAGNVFALPGPTDNVASSAVEQAKERVLATISSGWSTRAGELLALAVAARARAGLDCRALVEHGALESGYLERLDAQGCQLAMLAGGGSARGCAIVDGRTAWTPRLRIDGPLVRDLVTDFQQAWLDGFGELLPATAIPALDASGHGHGALIPPARLDLALRMLVASARTRIVLRAPAPGAALAIELVAATRDGIELDRGRVAGRTSTILAVDDAVAIVAAPGAPSVLIADRAFVPALGD